LLSRQALMCLTLSKTHSVIHSLSDRFLAAGYNP